MRSSQSLAIVWAMCILCWPRASVGATSHQAFDSAGTEIVFTTAGQGPPVILLHGFTRTRRDWVDGGTLDRLSTQFRVVAVDARGHGESGRPHSPDKYGIEMVRDVARLMNHLGIHRAHVVGSSMGGFTALKFAALYPERVSSLLIVGAGWLNADWAKIGPEWEAFAAQLEKGTADVGKNDALALAAVLRGAEGFLMDKAALAAVKMPLLAIMGGNDSFRPLLTALAEVVPQLQIEWLPGRDHNNTEAHPDFVNLIEAFLVGRQAHR